MGIVGISRIFSITNTGTATFSDPTKTTFVKMIAIDHNVGVPIPQDVDVTIAVTKAIGGGTASIRETRVSSGSPNQVFFDPIVLEPNDILRFTVSYVSAGNSTTTFFLSGGQG